MPAAKRRTQEERRSTTIARLLDATIAALANQGYARTTVAGVCKEAKLSQGALFRHFPSRAALIAAATEEICRRHIAIVGKSVVSARSAKGLAAAKALVTTIRDASRTPEHAAWHEVMVAARSDETLRALVSPTLQAFEADLLSALRKLGGATGQNPRFGTILLSLMHVFDSEAVTIAVYGNPPLEADRVEWLAGLLHQELMLP